MLLIIQRHSWLIVLLFAWGFFGHTQFSTPNLIAYDGHFHIKYAYLMRTEGIFLHKDILPFTILKGEFLDHHFLYHILLMPFTFLDLRTAGKLGPVVFCTLMSMVFFFILRRQKVPWAPFWVIILLSSSYPFLFRMSMARVMCVALIFQLILVLLLIEKRHLAVFFFGFFYVWLHFTASFVVPVIALFYVLAVLLADQKFQPAVLGYAVGGWVAGYVINPFFPHNVFFTIKANSHKLFGESSVSVGKEWYGYDSDFLFNSSVPAFTALFLGVIMLGLAGKKIRRDTLFVLFLMVLYTIGTMEARRFIEYWAPFTVLFCALAARDFFNSDENPGIIQWMAGFKKPLCSILFIIVGAGFYYTTVELVEDLRFSDSNETNRFAPAAKWLEEHTTEGEVVFNADWDNLPEFFFHNSKNAFVSGMDPAFMEMEDRERYHKYKEITRGKISHPSGLILKTFKARYIFTRNHAKEFIKALKKDKRIKRVFKDRTCSIFEALPQK